ncbi:MAG: hypothetical protein ABSE63_04795 [Thermoguttaceae bacterium]
MVAPSTLHAGCAPRGQSSLPNARPAGSRERRIQRLVMPLAIPQV